MMGEPFGRTLVETTVQFGDKPKIGMIEVGGKATFCCFMFLRRNCSVRTLDHKAYIAYQTYICPLEVRAKRLFLLALKVQQGEPRLSVGIKLLGSCFRP